MSGCMEMRSHCKTEAYQGEKRCDWVDDENSGQGRTRGSRQRKVTACCVGIELIRIVSNFYAGTLILRASAKDSIVDTLIAAEWDGTDYRCRKTTEQKQDERDAEED